MKTSNKVVRGNGEPKQLNRGTQESPRANKTWWKHIFHHLIDIVIAHSIYEVMREQIHTLITML